MRFEELRCAHACRNACALLNESLRDETALLHRYEEIIAQCDYPDVRRFIKELAEQRSESILRIVQKLNEMQARAQILDGVIASYDSASAESALRRRNL